MGTWRTHVEWERELRNLLQGGEFDGEEPLNVGDIFHDFADALMFADINSGGDGKHKGKQYDAYKISTVASGFLISFSGIVLEELINEGVSASDAIKILNPDMKTATDELIPTTDELILRMKLQSKLWEFLKWFMQQKITIVEARRLLYGTVASDKVFSFGSSNFIRQKVNEYKEFKAEQKRKETEQYFKKSTDEH